MFQIPGLSPELMATIRAQSPIAEKQGTLTTVQLRLIYEQKWFHLFVPRQYGGLELSLPEVVRLEENLAYVDGSLAWVVTLCAGAGMFVGYLGEDLAKEIFDDPHACLAGSGQSNGLAKSAGNYFEVSGSWPYASGAPHATHFTGNCIVNGTDQIQSFIFKKEEVQLQPNWHYIGLNATAGYSYAVKETIIPSNRAFIIGAAFAQLPQPVYRYPFLQLAETTIAANISGMCMNFFELAKGLLNKKENTNTRSERVKQKGLQLVDSGTHKIELLRKRFYDALDTSWSSHLAHGSIPAKELLTVSQSSIRLAQLSRNLVNKLYPYCGLDAARTDTCLNQVWRNINTASQHTLLLQVC